MEKCSLYLGSGRNCVRPQNHNEEEQHTDEPDLNGLWEYLDKIARDKKESAE